MTKADQISTALTELLSTPSLGITNENVDQIGIRRRLVFQLPLSGSRNAEDALDLL